MNNMTDSPVFCSKDWMTWSPTSSRNISGSNSLTLSMLEPKIIDGIII